VAQPPVEFTACVSPGPPVTNGTREVVEVSLPDGEMTIRRQRGFTWRTPSSQVTDPRLDGTWYSSYDNDSYTVPGSEYGPSGQGGVLNIGVKTIRIETDEGSWQGSAVDTFLSDTAQANPPIVLIGDGTYVGLTAIVVASDKDCEGFEGVIIEGSIPEPPVPQTGQ
jgi:hypothetical protein